MEHPQRTNHSRADFDFLPVDAAAGGRIVHLNLAACSRHLHLPADFLLLLPLVSIFFDVGSLAVLPGVLGVAALGLVGYAAWGTLFAALAKGLRARELLLSVVLFPSLVPLWIGAVKLTNALWGEGSIDPVRDWIKVLAVMDVLGLALAAFLYELIQEATE